MVAEKGWIVGQSYTAVAENMGFVGLVVGKSQACRNNGICGTKLLILC
jgi:hypothetical protein